MVICYNKKAAEKAAATGLSEAIGAGSLIDAQRAAAAGFLLTLG
jgi:hypothetical protein